ASAGYTFASSPIIFFNACGTVIPWETHMLSITSVDPDGTVHGNFYATGHQPLTLNWLTQTNFNENTDLFHARELPLSGSQNDQQNEQES
ncbi:MAG: hypothetical protein RLO18_08660, partial [Gimesia chilikensis]